jgi:glycosyltransferase involved in cell wall biosynthesis
LTSAPRLRALLIDPSLFTAPYDAALTEGLLAAGVEPSWAIRPTRCGDRDEIATPYVDLFFYRRIEGMARLPPRLRSLAKGVAHVLGLLRLVRRVQVCRPQVVHFQWAVVPLLDTLAMLLIRRWCPVLLTVHDTTPFNGEAASAWQRFAFDLPASCADRLIVHTQSARVELLRRGVPAHKVQVIAHGPLPLHAVPSRPAPHQQLELPWTFVLFGELKRYKGLDVLVEALALLPAAQRSRARVIVAGRPRMDLTAIVARSAELGLGGMLELRPQRLSAQEMADLFAGADCFLFPYRQIDASGVYFLVKSCSKWIIASRVGIFAEDVREGVQGALVPPEDPRALSEALAYAIAARPRPEPVSAGATWSAIGSATRELYLECIAQRPPVPAFARLRAWGIAVAVALGVGLATWLSSNVLAAGDGSTPALAALAPSTDTPPVTPLGIAPQAGYRLLRDWDFRRNIRDLAALRAEFYTRYIYANGTLDHLNDEWTRYRDAENHSFTPEGLTLVARPNGVPAPGKIDSGMLRSRWSGKYGVFEIRMKVPVGRGMWPAFWLNPQDLSWPPEIDIIEIVNNGHDNSKRSFHFLHGLGAETSHSGFAQLNREHAYEPGFDYAEAYHVCAVEWLPERVRHLVDGVIFADREYRWQHDDGSDGGPAHVLVNLAVGGKWPGPPAARRLPARLQIEYIRVWQH